MGNSKTATKQAEELKMRLALAAADSMGGVAFAALAVDELEQAIAATLGSDTKGCENLLWELVGALDVADATDASKKPIVTEYARRIAATLGSDELPYDELLRCLENDWHISASWDGLRKFWCIELTDEGVKLREAAHGTLTAEQVRECVQHVYHEGYSDGSVRRGAHIDETDWQAIADQLNAKLGSGTCRITASATDGLCSDNPRQYFELSCGHSFTLDGLGAPVACAVCGKAVER